MIGGGRLSGAAIDYASPAKSLAPLPVTLPRAKISAKLFYFRTKTALRTIDPFVAPPVDIRPPRAIVRPEKIDHCHFDR